MAGRIPSKFVLLMSALLLTGCVPLAPSPPEVPLMHGNTKAFGLSGDMVLNLGVPEVPVQFGGAQMWYRRSIDSDAEFFVHAGSLIGIGVFPYAGAGYRRYWIQPKSDGGLLSVGGEFSGGILWARVGLPTSLRLGNLPVWLTTHPSVGVTNLGLLHVPVGLSINVTDKWQFNAHAGAWMLKDFDFNSTRLYATSSLAVSW